MSSPFPKARRVLTGVGADEKFEFKIDEAIQGVEFPGGAAFNFSYTKKEGDTEDHVPEDLKAFEKDGLGVVMTPGTRCAVVDFPPGMDGELHASLAFEIGIVWEGEIIISLDNGDSRSLTKGDIIVQRGSQHAWKNPSQTEWVRMYLVMNQTP